MKCSLFLAIFSSLNADTFYEIKAKRECEKLVQKGGTYLMWKKDWQQVDGGMQMNWKLSFKNRDNCSITSINNKKDFSR
tara:strand:- start:218 stop:454 length:237 start_codon:yes stop_codon:yes gene_type:complete